MREFLLAAAFSFLATAAFPQAVQQSGTVARGHAAAWVGTGILQDGGTAASGNFTSLGVTASGPGICQNSDLVAAAGYQRICMGATTAGGGFISVQNIGTAPALPLQFNVNGSTFNFPTGGNNFLTAANPITSGNAVCYSGTTGLTVSCSGASLFTAGPGLSYAPPNLNIDIGSLSADTSPNASTDYLMMRKANGTLVKINPTTIAGTNTAGVGTVGGLSGTVGIGTGITTSGNSILIDGAVANLNCNGTADNYAAIVAQAAIARATGADMLFPAGLCVIDMTGQATINISGAGISGVNTGYYNPPTGLSSTGTVLLIKGTTASPFTSTNGRSYIRNLVLQWPNQTTPGSPTVYPAAFDIANGANVIFDNITGTNCYVCISLSGSTGFTQVKNSRFAYLNAGITVATTLAENIFTNNDFSYSWGDAFYNALSVQAAWRTAFQANAVGISYTGTNADAQIISNNVFFANQTGIKVSHTGADSYLWATITGNHFDGNYRAIFFANTSRPLNTTISSNTFGYQGSATGSTHIIAAMSGTTANYSATIAGNILGCSTAGHISIVGDSGQKGDIAVTGNSSFCQGYNQAMGGPFYSLALSGDAIRMTYSGNTIDGFGSILARGILGTSFNTLAVNGNGFMDMALSIQIVAGNVATIVGNTKSLVTTDITGAASTQKEGLNSWN